MIYLVTTSTLNFKMMMLIIYNSKLIQKTAIKNGSGNGHILTLIRVKIK